MAAQTDHPCFQPPPDPNIKIWRYMDFTKYVAFLEKGALYFSRADRLGDPYEGATSHVNVALRPIVYKNSKIPPKLFARLHEFSAWIRQWTFVNCWHMNKHESAAMWRLYAQTGEAVAIQSTYRKLLSCLPQDACVGIVHYIDYETELLPEENFMWRFVHKRKSFEHECELRAVIQELPEKEEGIAVGAENPELGKLVEINVPDLVERVLFLRLRQSGLQSWWMPLLSGLDTRLR